MRPIEVIGVVLSGILAVLFFPFFLLGLIWGMIYLAFDAGHNKAYYFLEWVAAGFKTPSLPKETYVGE